MQAITLPGLALLCVPAEYNRRGKQIPEMYVLSEIHVLYSVGQKPRSNATVSMAMSDLLLRSPPKMVGKIMGNNHPASKSIS